MKKPAKTAPPAADDDKLPPTPAWLMTVLIVILLGLVTVTVKVALYPAPPEEWKRIFETPEMPMAEVNKILSDGHAILDSVKQKDDSTIETWSMKHRTGTWSALVTLKKTSRGTVFGTAEVRCDIHNLPSFTRKWEYPEKK